MTNLLYIILLFLLSGCATTAPLSSQVTDAERKAVYDDLERRRAAGSDQQVHLEGLGKKIIAANSSSAIQDIRFKIGGENSGVSAYADGKRCIYLSPQMMRFVQNDDELAFVLSHEIGHTLKGHHVKTSIGRVFSGVAGAAVGAYAEKYAKGAGQLAAPTVDRAVWSPFSKEMEMEADEVALGYMKKAGYDPRAGLSVIKRFAVELPTSQNSSWASTHPTSPERLIYLQALVEKGAIA